jgi:ribonuclease P protein component
MIKLWKRLSSKEFQVMFQSGTFFSGNRLSIVVKPNFMSSHVGFTIKKGKKNSVERNYYKRILREAFIDVQFNVPNNWSIVLIANPNQGTFKLDQVRFDLLQKLDSAKVFFESKNEKNTIVSC